MRDRSFIAAVAIVGALAVLILIGNVRDAAAPYFGPPNVDQDVVMSKVRGGELSFEEARFYSLESGQGPRGRDSGAAPIDEADPADPSRAAETEAGHEEDP